MALVIGVVSVAVYNPLSAHLKQQATEIEAGLRQRTQGRLGKEIWIRQKSLDGQAIIRAEAAVERTDDDLAA